ncbi:hypothetical protein [Serratia phage BUCT660]|nr:hypothetical protein [Serratia phage BUCT660]
MHTVNAIIRTIETNPEFDKIAAPFNRTLVLARKGKVKKMIKMIESLANEPTELYVIRIETGDSWFKTPVGGDHWILSRTEISRLRAALYRAIEKDSYPVKLSRTIVQYQPIVNFVK